MIRPILSCVALSAALWLTGCGPTVKVNTAAVSDLSRYRTYAWYAGGSGGEGDIVGLYGGREQLAAEVLRKSIDEGLKRNGFSPAAADAEADVLVLYRLGVTSRREVDEYKTVQRNGETFAVPEEVTIYRGGTLLIYLLDPRLNDVVWAGTASAEAKAADSDAEARSRLEKAVRSVFDAMKKDRKKS